MFASVDNDHYHLPIYHFLSFFSPLPLLSRYFRLFAYLLLPCCTPFVTSLISSFFSQTLAHTTSTTTVLTAVTTTTTITTTTESASLSSAFPETTSASNGSQSAFAGFDDAFT